MSSSVDFWYRRISRRATVPGLYKTLGKIERAKCFNLWHHHKIYLIRKEQKTKPARWRPFVYLYLWGFFTPPVDGALFLAALVASCFLGAFPPVDLRAVCLVRAIIYLWMFFFFFKEEIRYKALFAQNQSLYSSNTQLRLFFTSNHILTRYEQMLSGGKNVSGGFKQNIIQQRIPSEGTVCRSCHTAGSGNTEPTSCAVRFFLSG